MKSQGITFSKEYDKTHDRQEKRFSIAVFGDTNEYLAIIDALLTMVGGISDDFCSQGDRYYVTELIKSMLPSFEQIRMIEESQIKER